MEGPCRSASASTSFVSFVSSRFPKMHPVATRRTSPRLIGLATVLLFCLPALTHAADSPERWEEAIRQFEQQDEQEAPPSGAILFVGSSSIRLWDLKKHFPDWQAINRGFGGSQTSDVLHYFDRVVLRYRPRVVVFYSGDNDVAAGKSAADVTRDVQTLLERVAEHLPETHVVLLPVKPSLARWEKWDTMREVNERMQHFAKTLDKVHYADTATPMLNDQGEPEPKWFVADRLHLSSEGYELWSRIVRETVSAIDQPSQAE